MSGPSESSGTYDQSLEDRAKVLVARPTPVQGEPERFSPDKASFVGTKPDGDYVRYSDYAKLKEASTTNSQGWEHQWLMERDLKCAAIERERLATAENTKLKEQLAETLSTRDNAMEAVATLRQRLAEGREPVASVIAECAANDEACGWSSCTGCYETSEGYSIGHYPVSPIYECEVGSGCSECGGIGVVWNYISKAQLDEWAAAPIASSVPSVGAARVPQPGEIWTHKPWPVRIIADLDGVSYVTEQGYGESTYDHFMECYDPPGQTPAPVSGTREALPTWRVGEWGDGSTPAGMAMIFCDALETVVVHEPITRTIAEQLVDAHNTSLSVPERGS